MSMMTMDGYVAKIEFDAEEQAFHGAVVNTRAALTFWGASVEELEQEFRTTLKVYKEVCKERGIKPEKPVSGTTNLRMGSERHSRVAARAAASGVSLNEFINQALDAAVGASGAGNRKTA